MEKSATIPIWKKAPFLRLLIPLIAGLLIQWYAPLSSHWILLTLSSLFLFLILLLFLPIRVRFRFPLLPGIVLNILLAAGGMFLIFQKYAPNHSEWIGHYYKDSTLIIATIEEPLSEKENSFKAIASVSGIIVNNKSIPADSHLIIYFRKDSTIPALQYGSQLLFSRPLQPIKSTGNPGAFNYQQYASFQNIYYQVFLRPGDWILLKNKKNNRVRQFLFKSRAKIISILRTYVKGTKETGLAEAMLIGYKDDLDKDLVQAYSNTGVVHVIAISGLHLGLIYWLLTLLFRPFARNKKMKWVKPITIIAGLWMFSLLTGGSPSVLRSALMFSCIVLGESLSKKTSVYNSLAASAFLLLCYNPFWLWDVGFQLSYIAVLSIIIFSKPIYNLFYFPGKILDAVWKLTAVTIAAQILTTPISIYYFHQFPLLFMVTNLVAVPLSSIILLGEIVLCSISIIPFIAIPVGLVVQWLIKALNYFIEEINKIPFSVFSSLYITLAQAFVLYLVIAALGFWLMQKNKKALILALFSLFGFVLLRSFSFIHSNYQQKIIIYNTPKQQAIDFINGRHYFFKGDSALESNASLLNFHLTPSRILHRCSYVKTLEGLYKSNNLFIFGSTRIVMIDSGYQFIKGKPKIKADLIILSKNPRLYITDLLSIFDCKQIVIDGSNPSWKVNLWQKDCEKAGIACHRVDINGAFEMNLP